MPELHWDQAYKDYIPKVLATKSMVEYYRVLERFAALLKDGHTGIFWPNQVSEFYDHPKILLQEVHHRAIVVNVGESLKEKLPLGSEIVEVNNVATEEYLRTEIFPYVFSSTDHVLWDIGVKKLLLGPAGSKIKIKVRTPKGAVNVLKVIRNSRNLTEDWAYPRGRDGQRLEFKWLKNDIAYIALNTFSDKKIVEEFEHILPELQKSKGLILDIRRNSGGSSRIGYAIIKYLTNQPFLSSKWKTREHRAAFKAWGKYYAELSPQEISKLKADASAEEREWVDQVTKYYKGTVWYESGPDVIKPEEGKKITVPIIVLIGHGTVSAAEDFLIAMDSIKRATFVGQKTCGSTGQPLMFDLPGGGFAIICTKRDAYPDGREFVGYGVSPHVHVEPTEEDIFGDRDVVLEKGVEVLNQQIRSSQR